MSTLMLEKEFFIHTSFVDKDDNIRPFAIWEIFQAIAGEHAQMIGVGFKEMYEKGILWVVVSEEYEVVSRLPRNSETIKVVTWPRPNSRLEFLREYEMRDMDNNLLVKGIASWTILDKETHKLSRAQVTFDGDFYSNSNYPENYRRKKMNLVPNGDVKEWDYNVLLSDLDHNGHMNNAKYFDVAYNMQASSSLPKCGMIQFVNEAKLGDTIHIKYFKNEDGKECYVGTLGDSTCFNIEYDV